MSIPTKVAYLCLQTTREGQASHAHVHEIIKGLTNLGWKVDLWQPNYQPRLIARAIAFFLLQARLALRLYRYDVLYVRSHALCLPMALVAKVLRIPVVQELNGMYDDAVAAYPWLKPFASIHSAVMDLQLKLANGVIVVTEQFSGWVKNRVPAGVRVWVVPNGADTDRFRPEAKSSLTLPDKYAVFFGALSPWQGINTLLDAVKLPGWPIGVRLVIAGDGHAKQAVLDAANRGTITYLGRVPYNDIPGLVAGSICSLIPKVDDGLGYSSTGLAPVKLFESMACGVPVIVTDFPGMRDIVTASECGAVIPQNDPGALAAALSQFAVNPQVRKEYGSRGRNAAVQHHSWVSRAEETAGILEQVIVTRQSKVTVTNEL